MIFKELLERLIYLDRDFVTGFYEAHLGQAPATQITKSEGMNAGAKIPFFSAGLSAAETKSFNISTLGMAQKLYSEFLKYPNFEIPPVKQVAPSSIGWIQGELKVFEVGVSPQINGQNNSKQETERASEGYFAIHAKSGLKLALISSPDYFTSGVESFIRLRGTIVDTVSIPVKAMVRVYSAESSFSEWIGVPLIIHESAI